MKNCEMKGAERLRMNVFFMLVRCVQNVRGQSSYLVLSSSFFSQSLDSRHTDCQMEATDVEELRILYLLPDTLRLQMVDLVVVRSGKVGA